MELALYHPELGYYARPWLPMGSGGDYLTSPEVSNLFGATLVRHCRQVWSDSRSPENWSIVELGGGSGRLCRDLVQSLASDGGFAREFRYTIVESSAALCSAQHQMVRDLPHLVDWVGSVDDLPGNFRGHVISNEFFDALPTHRVTVRGGSLVEVMVGLNQHGQLADELGEPSQGLQDHFKRLGILPAEGTMAEASLQAPGLARNVAERLEVGAMTTFDYGYEAPELYAPWRREGTLLCFYKHSFANDPYVRVGQQDITAHVDFTSLRHACLEAGLEPEAFCTQTEMLSSLGIERWITEDLGPDERSSRRAAIQKLLDPVGLGRIRVLVMRK
jgi:SAM-dependent MidA family methyltransferase